MLELLMAPVLALAPQDPVVSSSPAATAAQPAEQAREASRGSADPVAVATLIHHEKQGPSELGTEEISALLEHDSAGVVARAAWLLGQWKSKESERLLGDLATSHSMPMVRMQAMASLANFATSNSIASLTEAAKDDDRRIRTMAIQTLGRLGTTTAVDPVLSVLEQHGNTASENPTDLVVALVMLHDIGDPNHLLPAAESISITNTKVGQALAFLFQGVTPRLDAAEEVSTLLAVLDHPEPRLRRYAIQRLGELRDGSSIAALEQRLAVEDTELQPLIQLSLAQVRGNSEAPPNDLIARAKDNVSAIATMVEQRWNKLNANAQLTVIALVGVVILSSIVLLVAWQRSRRRAKVAAATALVDPSEEFQDEEDWEEGVLQSEQDALDWEAEEVEEELFETSSTNRDLD